MEIVKAPIYIKLTEEERKTLYDAYHIISNIGEEYSMSQVRDTSNLLAALIGSDKMQLENK